MSIDGHRTKWHRNIVEHSNHLSRAHERYRQTDDRRQTDGRTTSSEREREFTFAKKIGQNIPYWNKRTTKTRKQSHRISGNYYIIINRSGLL